MSETLVKVEGVSKKFCRSLKKSLWYGMQDLGREMTGHRHGGDGELRPDEFWAVKDVSFELKRGECLGLVGHNGAGKTTLLKMLNGLVKPDAGQIQMRGRVGAIIALGAGFNPILTGRENIYVNASVLGLSKREIDERIDEIIDFSEIEEYIDMPVQSYSSGMSVRLGFSIASVISPDILILDEVLAVGDANFQNKCIKRIGELVSKTAVVVVSHQAHHINKLCDTVLLLERGRAVESGPPEEILKLYQVKSASAPVSVSPIKLVDKCVTEFDVSLGKDSICWGEAIVISLSITVNRIINCTQGYINIIDAREEICAQVRLFDVIGELSPGLNSRRISIESLRLVGGTYQMSIQLYGKDKRVLIAIRKFATFFIDGYANLGVSYCPEAMILRD